MAVHQVPEHGKDDEELLEFAPGIHIAPGALLDRATVPLVIYYEGERRVIGEAVVDGEQVTAKVGPEAGPEIMDLIFGRAPETAFVLNFNPTPDPYEKLSPISRYLQEDLPDGYTHPRPTQDSTGDQGP